MAQSQVSDRTAVNEAPQQKVGKDSQLSTVSQLGSAEGSSGSFGVNHGAINEQQTSNLDLKPMFDQSLGAELGLTGNTLSAENATATNNAATQLSTLGSQLTAEGAAMSAVGQDLTTIGKDLNTLQTDINTLLSSLNIAAGGPNGSTGGDTMGQPRQHGSDGGSQSHHGGGHCGHGGSDTGSGCGSGCGSADTPPSPTPGNDTPPSPAPGNDTPPSPAPGNDTPPSPAPGNDTPPSPAPGNDTPPSPAPGNDTPPSPAPGNDTPPSPTPGNDTPPSPTPGTVTPPVTTPSDGSGFAINNGQLDINGKLLNGVAVTSEYIQQVGAQTAADNIKSQFPGINVVRLATSPYGGAFTGGTQLAGGATVADIDQEIKAFNADGIGVIVDNHDSDANTPNNVAQTGNEAAWFGQLAQDNLGNNMVMFQPENEPMGSDADVTAEQKATYDAIRATGSNAIVAFDMVGGGGTTPFQTNAGVYDQMSNYVIDAHSYQDPNNIASEIAGVAGLTEANGGKVPVYIGETGNAIDGSNIDAQGNQVLNTDWTDGTGAIAWLYDGAATGYGNGNGADMMTNSDGSLTGYGQQIAGLIQEGAS